MLTGVGVAALGAGLGIFFGPRQTTIDELKTKCGGDNSCPPSAKTTADKGKLLTGIAEGAVGVGAASIITGIILIATHSSKSSEPNKKADSNTRFIGAAPGANLGGISLIGTF